MTDRQFVRSVYPQAALDYRAIPATNYGVRGILRIATEYYMVRVTYPHGEIIARGATAAKAWRKAKKIIKKGKINNGK